MEGPLRFRCPPEFEAVAGGGVPLGGPGSELWLIRAPADFCPQSLEGLAVPLQGLERLRTPRGDNDGDNDTEGDNATKQELYLLRGGRGGGDCPLLLLLSPSVPSPCPGGSLGCAPPLRGSLSITRSFPSPTPGETPMRRKKRKRRKVTVTEEVVALGDAVTSSLEEGGGTSVPPAGTEVGEGPGPPPSQETPEEGGRGRRRRKKRKEKGEGRE